MEEILSETVQLLCFIKCPETLAVARETKSDAWKSWSYIRKEQKEPSCCGTVYRSYKVQSSERYSTNNGEGETSRKCSQVQVEPAYLHWSITDMLWA